MRQVKGKVRKVCGAPTRSGEPCKRPAGYATDHPGEGRCKYHPGGRPGAPKGNKNALTHGLYERIGHDTLTDDELEIVELLKGPRLDLLTLAHMELALLAIRERRVMLSIKELMRSEFVLVERRTIKGQRSGDPVDLTVERWRASSERIVRLERVLDGIDRLKAKYLEMLHEMKSRSAEASNDPIRGLVEAVERSISALDQPEDEETKGEEGEDADMAKAAFDKELSTYTQFPRG